MTYDVGALQQHDCADGGEISTLSMGIPSIGALGESDGNVKGGAKVDHWDGAKVDHWDGAKGYQLRER
jgi:hypothetical protein